MSERFGRLAVAALTSAAFAAVGLGSAPAEAASKATSLTMKASDASVAKGKLISLSGVLKSGNTALRSRAVTISFRRKNAKAYAVVGTVKTDAAGRYQTAKAVTTTGVWKVDYRGNSAYRPASATKTVTATATASKLVISFGKIVGYHNPEDEYPVPVAVWDADIDYRSLSRTYRVDWSYSCGPAAKIGVGWHLYWIDGNTGDDLIDMVDVNEAGPMLSGSFVAHDGWDGDPYGRSYRFFKLEIWGEGGDSCTSSIKIYSAVRVAV
jgi:hypothetical protein